MKDLIYNEWLPYTEYEKAECDIKLKDGTIIYHLWPNAGNFNRLCGDRTANESYPESDVVEIRYIHYYQNDLCNGKCNAPRMKICVTGHGKAQLVSAIHHALENKSIPITEPSIVRQNDYVYPYEMLPEVNNIKYMGRPAIELFPVRTDIKQQRNDLCLCGSGKKYKHCCLK